MTLHIETEGGERLLSVLLSVHLNARKAIMITATLLVSYVPSDREIAKTKLV